MQLYKNNSDLFLGPKEILELFDITTDKYIKLNTQTRITESLDSMSTDNLEYTKIDGRSFKKFKKPILKKIGDMVLEDYGNTDRIKKVLSKDFINVSEFSDVLKSVFKTNMNLIVHGKGGFGKSEMISKICNIPELKNRVFIKSLSEATTEEDLFGGINMKTLTETGKQEFICENSFANYEIVVLEELFDAPIRVLTALKDALTSGFIRNGNQQFKVKTKLIIGLTNKDMESLIEDQSIEALMQRFHVSYKLENKLNVLDVTSLLMQRIPNIDTKIIDSIWEHVSKSKEVISPRQIITIGQYVNSIKIDSKKEYNVRIANVNTSKIFEYVKFSKYTKFSTNLLTDLAEINVSVSDESLSNPNHICDILIKLRIIKNKIYNLALEDAIIFEILEKIEDTELILLQKI